MKYGLVFMLLILAAMGIALYGPTGVVPSITILATASTLSKATCGRWFP